MYQYYNIDASLGILVGMVHYDRSLTVHSECHVTAVSGAHNIFHMTVAFIT